MSAPRDLICRIVVSEGLAPDLLDSFVIKAEDLQDVKAVVESYHVAREVGFGSKSIYQSPELGFLWRQSVHVLSIWFQVYN